ncbi:Nose resistant to fluoxetine protein 6 [Aphelenchoides besseyi]|nr:Nose resistant to fluoxetine protein 6 [Aphelenchoides besseyi]
MWNVTLKCLLLSISLPLFTAIDFLKEASDVYSFVAEDQEFPIDVYDDLNLEHILADDRMATLLPNLSEYCRTDFTRLSVGMSNLRRGMANDFEQKVIPRLIDAAGKVEPGILKGHVNFFGMVYECNEINYEFTDSARPFRGQYVRLRLNANFANYSKCQTGYAMDFCLPYDCTTEDLLQTFRKMFEYKGPGYYSSPVCSVSRLNEESPLNYQSYIIIGIMSVVVLLCLCASLYDAFILPYRSPLHVDSFLLSCFRAFSSYTIVGEIMDTKSAKKPGQISQLHCMRFFSMCWVICGHSFGALIGLTDNPVDIFAVIGSFGGQVLVNSYYSVDTFFFQSGLLLSFLWFRAYRKNPKLIESCVFYSSHILHLLFGLKTLVIILFYVIPHYPVLMGVSPENLGQCSDKFWYPDVLWNFLYVNNIVGLKEPCYIVSWYLATDMQMYIFAPLLIIPYTINERFGVVFSLLILTLSTLTNFFTVLLYHFPPSNFFLGWQDPTAPEDATKYVLLIYNAAWIRCQVYIIGFVLGYYLQKTPKLRISRVFNLAGWVLTIGMVVAVTLPIRHWSLGQPMALGSRAAYSALSRIGWGLSLW